jgi:transposase
MFMQDNASIHTAYLIGNWFTEMGIPVMEHPPYSPGLNPIERVWKKLKELIYRLHPELLHTTGESQDDIDKLIKAIEEAWHAIPWSFFVKLADTMQHRCIAVEEADGWHTKY